MNAIRRRIFLSIFFATVTVSRFTSKTSAWPADRYNTGVIFTIAAFPWNRITKTLQKRHLHALLSPTVIFARPWSRLDHTFVEANKELRGICQQLQLSIVRKLDSFAIERIIRENPVLRLGLENCRKNHKLNAWYSSSDLIPASEEVAATNHLINHLATGLPF